MGPDPLPPPPLPRPLSLSLKQPPPKAAARKSGKYQATGRRRRPAPRPLPRHERFSCSARAPFVPPYQQKRARKAHRRRSLNAKTPPKGRLSPLGPSGSKHTCRRDQPRRSVHGKAGLRRRRAGGKGRRGEQQQHSSSSLCSTLPHTSLSRPRATGRKPRPRAPPRGVRWAHPREDRPRRAGSILRRRIAAPRASCARDHARLRSNSCATWRRRRGGGGVEETPPPSHLLFGARA